MDNYNGFNENENKGQNSTGYYGNYPLNDGGMNLSEENNNNSNRKKKKTNLKLKLLKYIRK